MNALQAPPLMAAVAVALILVIGNGLVLLSVRMAARGSLGRWSFAGIRTPATRMSDEAWLAGHRAALPIAYAGHGTAILFAVASLFASSAPMPYLVCLGVAVLGAITGVIGGFVVAHRAARSTLR